MNCLVEQQLALKESLVKDSVQVAKLQTHLNQIRRDMQTRSNSVETQRLTEEIDALKKNIEETRHSLELLTQLPENKQSSNRMNQNLPKDLPAFRVAELGNKFDVEDFLSVFEAKLRSFDVPDFLWSQIILSCIPGNDLPTLHWVQVNVTSLPWEKARKMILEHYLCVDTERIFNNLFLTTKMKSNDNIRHFADTFLYYVRKANLDSDSVLVRDRFLHAIPSKLKDQVLVSAANCRSLDDLIKIVISVNEIESSLSKFTSSTTMNSSNSTKQELSKKYCKNHGNCAHSTEECLNIKPKSVTSNSPLNGQPWKPHSSNSKKINSITVHQQPNSKDTNALSPSEVAAIFPDFLDSLPTFNINTVECSQSKFSIKPIMINGNTAFCQLDSGAEISLIPKKLVEKLNIDTIPCNTSLQFGQKGMHSTANEKTVPIKITFGDALFEWQFIVCDLVYNDTCLFGEDIWNLLGMKIANLPNFIEKTSPKDILSVNPNILHEENMQTYFNSKLQPFISANLGTSSKFCSIPESVIKLKLVPDAKPSWVSQYPIKPALREIVDKQVRDWYEKGIITFAEAGSNWNSSLIVVSKTNELNGNVKHRVCLDPRHINRLLMNDIYPIPHLRDILDNSAGFKYYSTIDLESSFHQLKLDSESTCITAFTWKNVHYKFLGAPFGLKTLTSAFQRVSSQLFFDLPNVFTFVDDILIASNSLEEHLLHVQSVVERLTKANLTINQKKCNFLLSQVHVLGHILSENGIQVDIGKLERVRNWVKPQSGKDIQSFLGLMNYFFDFIPRFAEIAKPLNELRNKDAIKEFWNDACDFAFENLKKCLFEAPILSNPNFQETFYLATDASAFAVGGVLFQTKQGFDVNSPKQKEIKYIKFYSHSLSKSERNYPASKRELFAIVKCLRKFQNYLTGVHCTIFTDHKPLSFFNSQPNLSSLHANWLDTLLNYDFEIIYYPGRFNILPDLLSRIFPDACKCSEEATILMVRNNETTDSDSSPYSHEEQIAVSMGKTIPSLEERNDLLLKNHISAHTGSQTVFKAIWNDNYYWNNMKKDCEKLCSECSACQKYNIVKKGFNPQTSVNATLPMDHIALDTLGPLPISKNGQKYILVVVDIFTRFVFLRAIQDKSAQSIAKELYLICCDFGHPRIIQSDNGTEFNNELLEHFSLLYKWDHRFSTPYYPQGNGIAERSVKSCINLLQKRVQEDITNWSSMLPSVQIGLNHNISSLHGSTPFSLMFARKLNPFNNFTDAQLTVPSAEDIQKRAQFVSNILFPSIKEHVQHKIEHRNSNWNKRHCIREQLPVGSVVMARIPGKRPKLKPPFVGPYRIVRRTNAATYILADSNGSILPRAFQLSQLKLVMADELTEEFYVELILDDNIDSLGKQTFLVRWFGYGPEYDSWEPKENFNDNTLINNYFASKAISSLEKGSYVDNQNININH